MALRNSTVHKVRNIFVAGLQIIFVLGVHVRSEPLPAEDEWTENEIGSFWVPVSVSKGRISAERNTGQLIGALATGVRITADGKPATISLRMGRTWDLSTTDRLVFAWRSETADVVESQPLTVTVRAKNEIGEGRSVYRISQTPGSDWSHVRLDLGDPIETDLSHGAADLRGVFRLDFTFACEGAEPALVVLDGLHFETSEKRILERAKRLGPLPERIRTERYGRFLVPLHAPNVTPEQLASYYAPLTEPPASPHQSWGNPLAGGPIRALILVTLSSEREVVELAQRFDLDYDLVPLAMVIRYNPAVLEDIARNKYDVIITSQLGNWPQSRPITDWIEEQVRQGTGWVAINTFGSFGTIRMAAEGTGYSDHTKWERAGSHWITDSVPIEALPRFSTYRTVTTEREADVLFASEGRPKLSVFRHGIGRIVNMCSGQGHGRSSLLPSPVRHDHIRTHFDYWEQEYSLVARSIRWAARREGSLRMKPVAPLQFDRRMKPIAPLQFYRTAGYQGIFRIVSDRPFRGIVLFRLLAADGAVGLDTVHPLEFGPDEIANLVVKFPSGLVSGKHVLSAEVRNEQGESVDWGSWICLVRDPLTLRDIKLGREFYVRDEPIPVEIRLHSDDDLQREVTLRCTIRDTFGRDVYRQDEEIKTAGREQNVFMMLRPAGGILRTDAYWLHVDVLDSKGRVAMDWRRLYVPIPAATKHETYWGGSGKTSLHVHPHLRSLMATTLRSLGLYVTWAAVDPDYIELNVENNLWSAPENIIHTGPWNQRFADGIRTPCLSDDEFLTSCVDLATGYVARVRKFSPIGYSSEEEMALNVGYPEGTTCLGASCSARFEQWLRSRYGEVSVLNEQWGTQYQTMGDAKGLRWEDGAKDLANPARWIDFRTFMETVFSRPQAAFNESIRAADPEAFSGYNGIAYGINPFSGIDRTRLAQDLSFSIEYQDTLLDDRGLNVPFELLRDSAPDAKFSSFVGYTDMENDHDRYWHKAWWMAFRQMYAPVYYTLLHEGDPKTTYHYHKIHQSYAYNTFTKLIADSTRPLMRGVGKLLMNSKLDDFGIAVYYSQPSMMRRYFEKHTGVVVGDLPIRDIREVIKDAGLHYRRLNTFQLLKGEAGRFSVLFLPNIVSIADPEWKAIREFAESGGTVIAFARAGLADSNGKVRADQNNAIGMFGIRYLDEACAWRMDTVDASVPGRAEVKFPVFRAYPEVSADNTCRALAWGQDEQPLVFLKQHGAGKAYYLHFSNHVDPSSQVMEYILSLLAGAGVARPFVLNPEERARNFQCFRFLTDGPDGPEYIGLLHSLTTQIQKGSELRLRFESEAELYDVLEKRRLGPGLEIQVEAPEKGRPRFYARLPYDVVELDVQFPKVMERGSAENLEARAMVSSGRREPDTHFFRVEVFDPAGKLVDPLSGNHVAKSGLLEKLVDIPFNARQGEWTVTVMDVVTGLEGKTSFEVIE